MVGTFREYLLPKYSSVLQSCEDDVEILHRLNRLSSNLGVELYSNWLQASETYFDSTPSQEQTPEERLSLNPIPDLTLRRTNPKRYDKRHDWYTYYTEHVTDSPTSNRYDNSIELTSALESRNALDALDWEIERTVEGRAVYASKETFIQALLQRVATKEKLLQEGIPYSKFPKVVKDYIYFRFSSYLDRYPELFKRLQDLRIVFLPKPEQYRASIGAEYFPETNIIGFYLSPEELNRHWDGIVHEIVHLMQDFLQGREGFSLPPDRNNPSYYTDREIYEQDPGEQQASTEARAFQDLRMSNA